MGDEFGIYYRPDVAAARVSGPRSRLIWGVGSLALSLVIFAVLWAIWPNIYGVWAPWLIGISVLTSGSMAAINLTRWMRARADARLALPGLAIGVNRAGILVGQRWLTWPEVGSMVIKPGVLGSADSFVTTVRDASTVAVPLGLTDTMPASLDAVVRVLSAGQAWVDLSRLD
ncbi:MAG: hypothetical protein K4304_02180 [Propionicimonas sp.]